MINENYQMSPLLYKPSQLKSFVYQYTLALSAFCVITKPFELCMQRFSVYFSVITEQRRLDYSVD